jgi:hypothetical protein
MLAIQRWKSAHSDHLKINKKKERMPIEVRFYFLLWRNSKIE